MKATSQKWVLVGAIALFIAVIVFIQMSFTGPPAPHAQGKSNSPHPLSVSVMEVTPATYQAGITAYGAATPHYEITLTSKVSGYISALSTHLENGSLVEKGEILLQLEDSDYRANVASAQQAVADARLELLEQQRQAQQARAEWNSANMEGQPDSELVLRQPYVDAAKAALSSAKAALQSAMADLQHTSIRSPFSGAIMERLVAYGAYVQTGSEIARLYSADRVEITLSISESQWQQLPTLEQMQNQQWPVQLSSSDGKQAWTGYVIRAERHLDTSTRQRSLIVAVNAPLQQSPPLLPGRFLTATIPGKQQDNLWRLPASAISQRGEVWYIDEQNALANFNANVQFSDGQFVYVAAPKNLSQQAQHIITHPLSSYLVGTPAAPLNDNQSVAERSAEGNHNG